MDEARIKKLFRFNITSKDGTEMEKGSGLGLAFSGEFIELNHGEIWVESKLNEGSTFYFSIPVPVDH